MTDVDKAGAVRMADAPGRLAPGDELGGYTVRALLGKGAMGAVYEAVDGGGTAVALKVLHSHLDRDPVARERLRREVTALQRLRHPAVARVLDAELDGEGAFVVTELVAGRTLEDEIDDGGPLDPTDLFELADQLAAALEAVHLAGVVHRDLKPSNVMVTAHGPVLIDFGIATALTDADDGGATLTQPGFVIGTPGYLAPELLDGATPSAESDWWSWAALLAFAATGRSPFGVRPTDLVLRRSREGRADLVGLPARTARALAAALQADPALRWGPSQVARALRRDSEESAFAAMAAADPAADPAVGDSAATQRIGTHPGRAASAAGALTGETTVVGAPTQLVGAPTEHVPAQQVPTEQVPAGASFEDAGSARDGLTRAVPVSPVDLGDIPVGEVRYQAYDGGDGSDDDVEPVPAEPYTAPRIAMRTGTVLAFAAPLVMLGATRPLIGFGVLAALVIVCRIAGTSAQAFWDRRERAGARRGSDGVVAALTFPWHVLVGALGSIAQLLVSACVGVLVVVGGYWLFGPGRVILAPRADIEARSVGGMNEEIVFGVLLAAATLVAVLVAWFGPAGMTGRKGARALLHTFAPGWIGAAVVIAACLIGAWLLAQPLLATPLEIHWWPLGGPPSL